MATSYVVHPRAHLLDFAVHERCGALRGSNARPGCALADVVGMQCVPILVASAERRTVAGLEGARLVVGGLDRGALAVRRASASDRFGLAWPEESVGHKKQVQLCRRTTALHATPTLRVRSPRAARTDVLTLCSSSPTTSSGWLVRQFLWRPQKSSSSMATCGHGLPVHARAGHEGPAESSGRRRLRRRRGGCRAGLNSAQHQSRRGYLRPTKRSYHLLLQATAGAAATHAVRV